MLAFLKYVYKCTHMHALRMQPVHTHATSIHVVHSVSTHATSVQPVSHTRSHTRSKHVSKKEATRKQTNTSNAPHFHHSFRHFAHVVHLQRVDQCDVVHAVFQHGPVTGAAGGTSTGVYIACFVVEKQIKNKGEYWSMGQRSKTTQRMNTSNIKTPTRGCTFFPRRLFLIVDHGNHKFNKASVPGRLCPEPPVVPGKKKKKRAEQNRGI